MRAYTVATTAITLGIPKKSVDNILSHFQVPGVTQSRQGIARSLTPRAVLILAVSLQLVQNLGIPQQLALNFAERLTDMGGTEARLPIAGLISLEMNVTSIARETDARLAHAVEVTPIPKRGRPLQNHRR